MDTEIDEEYWRALLQHMDTFISSLEDDNDEDYYEYPDRTDEV